MKTPISYYGGKQRLSSKIAKLIPRHTVYVEPFAGGAAIFFAKPWPKVTNTDNYREILNDKDQNLINFYKQLRDNGETLCEKLSLTLYSEEEYKIAKDLDSVDDLERARRYYVNIQQSFSNRLNSGWKRGVYGRNFAVTWSNKVSQLPEYIDRMASVIISCDDAIKVIKQWDSPHTFFYCDPPYPNADQGHYGGYSIQDFQALVDTLNACQGSFILSNYDQQSVTIPQDWERFEFQAKASAMRQYDKDGTNINRNRTEIVWRRFNRVQVRAEIKKLYESGAYDCFASGDEFGG